MGAFYGSVHVRTDDRDQVLAAAGKVARKDTRLLVGPALRGWVAVYPSGNGQNDRVARRLAKHVAGDVVYVMVHDSDVFAYSVFRDGKLIDQFNSQPDYFGAASDKEKAKLRGRPEKFAHLLPDPARLEDLRSLLAPDKAPGTVFADRLLAKFAELLGLANVDTAYEYLMEEDEGIEGREEFVHVPDLSNERAAKAVEEARQAQVRQRWREQGLLRVEERRAGKGFARVVPLFCPDGGSGFLVCWPGNWHAPEPVPLQRYQAPWTLPAPATGLTIEPITSLARSPSGRYVAMGGAAARVREFATREVVLEVAHTRGVEWVGFSSDEAHFISVGRGDIFVTSIETRQCVSSPAVEHGSHGAIHPCGMLVVTGESCRLNLIDVHTGAVNRSFKIGSKRELQSSERSMLALMKQRLDNYDPVEFERMLQTQIKQVDERVKAMVERLEAAGVTSSDERVEEMRVQLVEGVEKSRVWIENQRQQVATGHIEVSVERPSCLTISRDGRLLCLGTDRGVRVFAWEAVLAANTYLPEPVFQFDSAIMPAENNPYGFGLIYTMAVHEGGRQLIFGGIAGRIDSLDLTTGRHRVVCDLPGNPAVLRLCLSSDEANLACCVQPNLLAHGRDERPPELHIWDFAALLRNAG
jgi:hypothetical protein